MQTLCYRIDIHATQQKVWDVLWATDSYSTWMQFFSNGSTMQSDWKLGGKTYFLDAKGNGMLSTIERLDIPHAVVFKHLGFIQDGKEDLDSDEVKTWSGALEKYLLSHVDGVTTVQVEVDIPPAYADCMDKGFEQGLQVLKQLAE